MLMMFWHYSIFSWFNEGPVLVAACLVHTGAGTENPPLLNPVSYSLVDYFYFMVFIVSTPTSLILILYDLP